MQLTLQIAGLILTLFSFLPLIKSPLWWIRVLDFPRFHVALLLSAVLVAYLVFYGVSGSRDIAMIAVWGFAILNEMRYVYFFTPLAPREALRTEVEKPANAFSLMISNVRMTNKKYEKFLQLILQTDPDLVLINEPNNAWHEHLQPELDKRYPYAIKKPLENTYGMLLYSKFKLLESDIRFMVEDDIPSFYTVVELPSGLQFDLYTVHPQPPRLMQNTETREAELLIAAKYVKKSPHPSVVAGDLNDVAWSSTTKLFKQISGLLDPRVGRGFYNTYNAFVPFFRYPLDHVFYDPAFRLVHMERLSKFGSDHFPILITLNFEPKHEEEQHPPKPDREDYEEADELIQEGLEKGEERNGEKQAEKQENGIK
jgi:endonuclease/exonuclease/phosphatase (EEP) superfamily protein YafD